MQMLRTFFQEENNWFYMQFIRKCKILLADKINSFEQSGSDKGEI